MTRSSGREGSLFMFTNAAKGAVRPETASARFYVFKNVYFNFYWSTFKILQALMLQPMYADSVRVNKLYFN